MAAHVLFWRMAYCLKRITNMLGAATLTKSLLNA